MDTNAATDDEMTSHAADATAKKHPTTRIGPREVEGPRSSVAVVAVMVWASAQVVSGIVGHLGDRRYSTDQDLATRPESARRSSFRGLVVCKFIVLKQLFGRHSRHSPALAIGIGSKLPRRKNPAGATVLWEQPPCGTGSAAKGLPCQARAIALAALPRNEVRISGARHLSFCRHRARSRCVGSSTQSPRR